MTALRALAWSADVASPGVDDAQTFAASPSRPDGGAPVPLFSDRPVGGPAAMIGIARVAALTGVTLRTLRYYEAAGLLAPVRGRTRQRLFTPQQCDTAVLIVTLRRHGVSIPEIRMLLDDGLDRDARRETLSKLISGRLSTLRIALRELEELGARLT